MSYPQKRRRTRKTTSPLFSNRIYHINLKGYTSFGILTFQVYICIYFQCLIVYLADKKLKRLYETGHSPKLKLPAEIIEKFFATVQKIEAAENIQDLRADRGLNFEKLRGSSDSYSMRLNLKYRLEMRVSWSDEKQLVGVFYLKTISNHYK